MLVGKPRGAPSRSQHWFNRNTRRAGTRETSTAYDIGMPSVGSLSTFGPGSTVRLFLVPIRGRHDGGSDRPRTTTQPRSSPKRSICGLSETAGDRCGSGVCFAEILPQNLLPQRLVGASPSVRSRSAILRKRASRRRVLQRTRPVRDPTARLSRRRDQYDRIASIRDIEAVGERFGPPIFRKSRDRRLPGGLAGSSTRWTTSTIQDGAVPYTIARRRVDFIIPRYVFPGGMPGIAAPDSQSLSASASVSPYIRERLFGQDYAKQLTRHRRRHLPRPLASNLCHRL